MIDLTKISQAANVREPTKEELEEWAEIERQMENCPKKALHSDPEYMGNEGDGCLECGYGAK